MNSVDENAMQGQRSILMSAGFAELQYRDERNRRLKAKVEEDERPHAEQMNAAVTSRSSRNGAPEISMDTVRRTVEGNY